MPGSAVRTDSPGRPIGSYSAEEIDGAWWPSFRDALSAMNVSATLLIAQDPSNPPPRFLAIGSSESIAGGWVYELRSIRSFGCRSGEALGFGFSRSFADGGGISPAASFLQSIVATGPALSGNDPNALSLARCISQSEELQFNQFPVTFAPPFYFGSSPIKATIDLRLTFYYDPPNPLP
jgi:hypothetical protein